MLATLKNAVRIDAYYGSNGFAGNRRNFLRTFRSIKARKSPEILRFQDFLWYECSYRIFQKTLSYQRFFGFQSSKFPSLLHNISLNERLQFAVAHFLYQKGWDYLRFFPL